MLRKLVFKEPTRRIVSVLIYAVFLGLIIYSWVQAPDAAALPVYLVFLLFLAMAVLGEWLRYRYDKAAALVYDACDTEKARLALARVLKRDIFKTYVTRSIFLQVLMLTDDGESAKAIELSRDNSKRFKRPAEKMCYLYALFGAAYAAREITLAKDIFTDISRIPSDQFMKAVPFCCYMLMQAQYDLLCKQAEKAEKTFEKIDPALYNRREQAHYYLTRAHAAKMRQDKEQAAQWLAKAAEAAPAMKCLP